MKNHVPRGDADDISRTLAALEAGLGDPWEADAPVSHAALMRDDEAAAYPAGAYEALVAQDVNARLVPEALGGKLYACHESLLYFRSLARRCTTLATVALLPNIGYFAVLIAGTEEQKRRFGTALLHGDAICWGLSEKSYGSDVLSNATRAEPAADGYLISGEKWPIGLADRARMMVVQARTGEGPSPAAHTLLIFDRAEADRRTWAALPNEDLHGVRGLPLGGVRYDRAPVRTENRLGEEGRSLEIVLRAHQILRIGVSSTTLGAVDTGLRIALDFARSRQLFGEPIIGLPVTRRQLADAFADLFLCEILLTGAARALHVAPKRLYLQSSIVKFFIPTTMEAAMQSLSVLIGARYFLRGNFAQGVFQKMLRDAAMASFVDGNTLVNLRVIGSQMPLAFTRIATARENGLAEADRQTLDHLYDPRAPIGEAQWTKLDLQNNGLDLNLVGLADASARLAPGASPATRAALEELQRQLDALVARHDAARAAEGKGFMQSAVFYELAEQYCLLSAAGAAVQYAARAAGAVPEALQQVDWLGYCLGRILRRFDPADTRPDPAATDAMLGALEAMHDAHRAFSTIPHHYAGQPAATSGLEVSRG